jgi:hypothetical protein
MGAVRVALGGVAEATSLRVPWFSWRAPALHCRALESDESCPRFLASSFTSSSTASVCHRNGLAQFDGSQDLGPDSLAVAITDGYRLAYLVLGIFAAYFSGRNVPIGRALKQPAGDSMNIRQKAYE